MHRHPAASKVAVAKERSASHSQEFTTLLNELRVLLPGVEVLFAFLLTVPFTDRFQQVTTTQRVTYFVAFLAAALSAVMLVSPSIYHRVRWREADKENVLRTANTFALIGIAFLAVATGASVYLVSDVLFSQPAAAIFTAVIAVVMVCSWYVLPIWARTEHKGSRVPRSDPPPSPRPARPARRAPVSGRGG
jgi:amino acid transporter